MIKSELKSCPFCGGEAVMLEIGFYWWVRCRSCEAESKLSNTEGEAITAWNRRVGDSNDEVGS